MVQGIRRSVQLLLYEPKESHFSTRSTSRRTHPLKLSRPVVLLLQEMRKVSFSKFCKTSNFPLAKLFVGGLQATENAPAPNEDELVAYFSRWGTVSSFAIIKVRFVRLIMSLF